MSDERLRLLERRAWDDAPSMALYEAELARLSRRRLPDWGSSEDEVWKYAEGFGPQDTAETLAYDQGENDGAAWWALLRLRDGRYAYVTASCDYTGWG